MEAAIDLGRAIDSSVIQSGLRELCRDLAFDVAVNRPTEWENVMQFPNQQAIEAVRLNRLPVMYRDNYVCGLDRGVVTEHKQWSVKSVVTEIPWSEADNLNVEPSISWEIVNPTDPTYIDLYLEASTGMNPNLLVMPGVALARCKCMGYVKIRHRVIRLGWRHTFGRLIFAQLPGITVSSISLKFSVDMAKLPLGTTEDLRAMLVEE